MTGARLPSDVGLLRRVLVHEPGPETRKVLTLLGEADQPMLVADLMEEGAAREHRALVELLRQSGAEVLTLAGVLDEAVRHAAREGELEPWLRAALPGLAGRGEEVTASVLLGAEDAFVYHADAQGRLDPLTPPMNGALYVRDVAVMTPRGLILCDFVNRDRALEPALLRFALRWAPELRRYPVVFDAAAEGVHLQGGDVIVLDERTLLVGVGHRTEEAAAPRLAQRLEMDVVAVRMPGRRGGPPNGIRTLFLHLDSVFNLVGGNVALAVPYFLEAEFAGRDPLTRILAGLAERSRLPREELARALEGVEEVGWVSLYRAGSGEREGASRGEKLVDHLRARGYGIVYVGGQLPPPGSGELGHVVEGVLREMRYQAANVVATAPGRLLAYAGNEGTLASLRDAGVEVDTFPGGRLARWHGGPHCMTLPLERDAEARTG